ncbi:MAG: hypothetical protein R3C69_07585 [Geminicoccaceae bacterium]
MAGLLAFDEARHRPPARPRLFHLTAIEGQFITPISSAAASEMNTVVIFLSITFWA